jgi:immune inhibitor A
MPSFVIGAIIILSVCCACLVVIGAAAMIFYTSGTTISLDGDQSATPTPIVIRPSPSVTTVPTQTTTPETGQALSIDATPSPQPLQDSESDTIEVLDQVEVPTQDPIALAQRLEGKGEIPLTVEAPPVPRQAGERQTFWVSNSDTNENFEVDAELAAVTDHVYFWIEENVSYRKGDLAELVETFENEIYPTTRNFFGSEWTTGVDGDAHIYMLLARNLGESIAGYYSSKDEYHPLANEYSNAHEIFLLSADVLDLDDEFTYAVLAHEFQHMIHWNIDRNEESWVNEGLAELASFINGYGVGFHDYTYIEDPDIQLNTWPLESQVSHYGASFLFMNYFLNRFGDATTRELVASTENGLQSLNQVLAASNQVDPITGQAIQVEDVFSDWVLASYIKDETVFDGRYTYANYPEAPQATSTEVIERCPSGVQTRDVSQYGVDYIEVTCSGTNHFRFEGSVEILLLPVDPISGDYYFWSNQGDESNMTLTKYFDFRDYRGELTLTYWTWFHLEKDYDYVYVESSLDGGDTWDILITPFGTADDPSGNSYGWGYNGSSGDLFGKDVETARWIEESVDLSRYSGKEVLVRFEYVTDAAVNGEGLVLDDIAIPEIGYFSDLEADEGGWEAQGFVRINNVLPQTYQVAVIHYGEETTVQKYSISGENELDIPLEIGRGNQKAVVVVAGTTPYTRQKTAYRFEIAP